MRVGAIEEGFSGQTGKTPQEEAPVKSGAESRALVVLEAQPARERPATHRQSAFLAHLIATREQHPQTRARRRAEPGDALAAYRATAALTRRG